MNNQLRNTLGVMGALLPIALFVFNLPSIYPSISATYYSRSFVFFIGVVATVGVCLIRYTGYDIVDWWTSTLGGIGAITLILFPCTYSAPVNNFLNLPMSVTNIIHLIGAGLFFGMMIIISAFQFTKTSELNPTHRKLQRNILYVTCAFIMLAALVIGFACDIVFLGETIALFAFSTSWLTKGGLILKDEKV